MSRRSRSSRSAVLVASLLLGSACSGEAEPVGENRACFRALDCQSGLVCVEGRCTDDIGPIVPNGAGAATEEPEADPDAG